MITIKYITIDNSNNNLTFEKYILKTFNIYNYIYLQKLIRTGQIRVNKKRIRLGYLLKTGDVIRLPILDKPSYHSFPKSNLLSKQSHKKISNKAQKFLRLINKQILYEDDHIIAINKPSNLAVQGGKNISISLDYLLPYIKLNERFQKNNLSTELKVVHRLDKDTTGVLLIAKTNAAAKHLFKQFKERSIQKIYYCLVQGSAPQLGLIKDKLLKVNSISNKSILDNYGKSAVTLYNVLYISEKSYKSLDDKNKSYNITFLKVLPKTGRNHQIRAHLGLSLKCPIIGDFKYGYKMMSLPFNLEKNEIFLHAFSVTFTNLKGKTITVKAPLEDKWSKNLKKIGLLYIKDL